MMKIEIEWDEIPVGSGVCRIHTEFPYIAALMGDKANSYIYCDVIDQLFVFLPSLNDADWLHMYLLFYKIAMIKRRFVVEIVDQAAGIHQY